MTGVGEGLRADGADEGPRGRTLSIIISLYKDSGTNSVRLSLATRYCFR